MRRVLSLTSPVLYLAAACSVEDGGHAVPDAATGMESDAGADAASGLPPPVECGEDEIPCNGACLSEVGDTQHGCTLLLKRSPTARINSFHLWNKELLYGVYVDRWMSTLMALDLESNRSRELARVEGAITAIVRDGADIFFSVGELDDFPPVEGALYRLPAAGGTPVLLVDSIFAAVQLELVGDRVLAWAAYSFVSEYHVRSIPRAGGEFTSLALQGTCNFLVDESNLYGVSESTYDSVQRSSLSDPSSVTTMWESRAICGLGQDDAHLYWERVGPNGDGYVIERLSKDGGSPELVFESDRDKVGLFAVSNGYVYFSERGSSDVLQRVSTNGGAPLAIARAGDASSWLRTLYVGDQFALILVAEGLLKIDL